MVVALRNLFQDFSIPTCVITDIKANNINLEF